MKYLMVVISFLLGGNSFAQGSSGAGNGGKGVVCDSKTAYVLDYWNARNEAQLKISLGGRALSVDEKVELIISRLRKFDPDFATELEDRFVQFKTLSLIQNRLKIKEIDDAKETTDPKGNCYKFQIAVNRKKVDPFFNKKFLIDQDLWSLMNSDERAGLIFHEVLYWAEIEKGATDSLGTQRLNAIFSSQAWETLTLPGYIALLQLYSVRTTYSYQGRLISLKNEDTSFSAVGDLVHAKLLSKFTLENEQLKTVCLPQFMVEFNAAGEIVDCGIDSLEQRIHQGSVIQTNFYGGKASSWKQVSGEMAASKITSLSLVKLVLQSPEFKTPLPVDASPQLELYENGLLKSARGVIPGMNIDALNFSTIRLQDAELSGLSLNPEGQLSGLSLTAKGIAFLYSSTGKKFELSWKSGVYQVELDPNDHHVLNVR